MASMTKDHIRQTETSACLLRVDAAELARLAGPDFHALRAMRVLGADYAMVVLPPPIDDLAAFQGDVALSLTAQHRGDPAFCAALRDNTLCVQLAQDVPDFGYGEPLSVEVVVNGASAGIWHGPSRRRPFNHMLRQAVEATGIRQVFGALMGHGFYATWPDWRLQV